MKSFEARLSGGHHNSLGNTEEVANEVIENSAYLEELYNCYFSEDELVRLRTSSAFKRVCMADKKVLIPYIERFLNEISKIDQASTQWTLAILFNFLQDDMNKDQISQAKDLLKYNLAHHNDWIVLNYTMETLTNWASDDDDLKEWMKPFLEKLKLEKRKAVAGRAKKMYVKLY